MDTGEALLEQAAHSVRRGFDFMTVAVLDDTGSSISIVPET